MNKNQALLNTEEINPTLTVTEASWGVHSLECTNLSSSNLLERTNSTTPATEVPLGVITSIYSILPRQAEERDATMPSSGKSLVVQSEEAWRTNPYIEGSLHSLHSDEPRALDRPEPSFKKTFASLGPLTIGEEVQVEHEQKCSSIAVPQLPAEKTTISPGPITIGEQMQFEYDPAYSSLAVSQLPTERSTASPGQLIIDEAIQIQYDQEYPTIAVPQLQENNTNIGPGTLTKGDVQLQQEYPTIEVPLITDPNTTPELVTFRPGVYEGDAIPPVYSNFSIIATTKDYEPPVRVLVQPNMTIFPVPISQVQQMNEPVGNSINQEQWTENSLNENTVNLEGSQALPQVGENMVEQEQLITTGSNSTSGGRSIDGRTLVTQRDKRLILIYKGYHFSRYCCQGLKIRWQCVNPGCNAYLYSIGNKITVTHPVHNHLAIIGQNTSVPNSVTEPDTVFSLEEAISAMTDPVSSFNQGTDPKTLSAANTDMMTLSYDHDCQSTSIETTKQTTSSSSVVNNSSNFETSVGDVLAAANTIIPQNPHVGLAVEHTIISHDPSLEITVKSTLEETANDDEVISPSTTITSLPNPMDVCVANYTPNSPSYAGNSDPIFNPNFNYMSVPKDVSVKVTLTSVPKICEPQVYYDGKLAVKRNTHTSKTKREMTRDLVSPYAPSVSNKEMSLNISRDTITSTEVSVSTPISTIYSTAADASILTYYAASGPAIPNRGKPNINILRSQIVSGSDLHYSHLFNALTPRAQTLAPNPQIRLSGPANVTQGNSSVPVISTQTSNTFSNFIHNTPNFSMSMQSAQNTLIYGTSRNSNYPHIVQRSSRISILSDEQIDFSNRRTTRATTRARNMQSRQQNQ